MTKKESEPKKDSFNAKLSFILSMGFFIPLFNIGLSIAALIIAINSLRRINQYPDKFDGLKYSIAAITISATTIVLSIIFIFAYMYQRMSCDTLPKLF